MSPPGLRIFFSALAAAAALALPAAASADFTYQAQFGTTGPGTLTNPFGLALSHDGADVYVADHGSNKIFEFTRTGGFVRAWGGTGSAHGQLNLPDGLAVDPAGNVYVAECDNNRVQEFSATGTFINAFGRNGGDGSAGGGNGEFNCASAVAIDPAGRIVVGDDNNHRIQVLAPDGHFLMQIGSQGAGDGQFGDPEGLATDTAGDIYALDNDDGRIQEFTPGGAFIRKWGGPGAFTDIETLSVDPFGMVWVSEDQTPANRLDEFRPDGTLVARFGRNGGDGTAGSGNGEFNTPEQVGFDCRGNAYVADFQNKRVQAFGQPGLPQPLCHTPGVTTGPAVAATSSADLGGTVNDDSQVASYHFDYGTTNAYGSSTATQGVAAGTSPTGVISTAGGLSPSTTYHYRLVASNYTGTTAGPDETFTTAAIPPPRPAKISRVGQSARRWREGRRLARASRKPRVPVGTTFRYTLDKPAAVRFAFTQRGRGRRVGGKCVAQTKRNRKRHSCARTKVAGTLKFAGHAGANKVRFQGRLTRHKRLKPGRYTLVIRATTPGVGSTSAKLRFTIVK